MDAMFLVAFIPVTFLGAILGARCLRLQAELERRPEAPLPPPVPSPGRPRRQPQSQSAPSIPSES